MKDPGLSPGLTGSASELGAAEDHATPSSQDPQPTTLTQPVHDASGPMAATAALAAQAASPQESIIEADDVVSRPVPPSGATPVLTNSSSRL